MIFNEEFYAGSMGRDQSYLIKESWKEKRKDKYG